MRCREVSNVLVVDTDEEFYQESRKVVGVYVCQGVRQGWWSWNHVVYLLGSGVVGGTEWECSVVVVWSNLEV